MSKEKKDLKNDLSDDKQNKSANDEHGEVISKLQQENEELDNKYKRALADYQNLLKNSASEKSSLLKYSLENFLLEIIPVYDNLRMSVSTLNSEEKNNPWVEGIKYVIKQFQDIFASNGVSEIKTINEKFDYNTMEAVEGNGDVVISELRPGYYLKDKVIIPAKVILSSSEDKNNKEESEEAVL